MTPLTFATFALLAAACANAPSTSDTSHFLGRWSYQPGSTVVIACPDAPQQSIDLSRAIGGQPAFFTLSAGSASASGEIHEIDARGCQYDWTVSGGVATANPNQSCSMFPDGKGGSQLVHLQNGTKTTSDGVTMTVDVHFTNDNNCPITVTGTANP